MATIAVEDLTWIEVRGSLDAKAIASSIAVDAHERVGEMLALVDDWLIEDGRRLNQKQKIELLQTALRCMDGFERQVLVTLVNEFTHTKDAARRGSASVDAIAEHLQKLCDVTEREARDLCEHAEDDWSRAKLVEQILEDMRNEAEIMVAQLRHRGDDGR